MALQLQLRGGRGTKIQKYQKYVERKKALKFQKHCIQLSIGTGTLFPKFYYAILWRYIVVADLYKNIED